MKKQVDGLKHELKTIKTILSALTICKNRNPQSYWTVDQSTSQVDLILLLHIFAPDCGLFTKCKNKQWKYVEEHLLQMLSKAAVDAKEEQFTWWHAVLQEQLQEAERESCSQQRMMGAGDKILSLPVEFTMNKTQSANRRQNSCDAGGKDDACDT